MNTTDNQNEAASKAASHSFQAEVSKLLHLMVHSVYSNKEVFLRELISNASDACDKLRYEALTQPALVSGEAHFRIEITIDKEKRRLTLADNGIGMSQEELIENLGTIAKSGTSDFVTKLSGDEAADSQLIGQFGVGFYSAFMVATKVDVVSRKAGSNEAFLWTSDGEGSFEVTPTTKSAALLDGRGTCITLHLRDDEDEFLEAQRLKNIIKSYSDHIAMPIFVLGGIDPKEEGEEEESPQAVNSASALWTRPKSDITEEQYKEFYHHVGHVFDDPAMTIHYKAEGRHEYSVLLFVPSQRPMDLFDPNRQTRLKLYVKRVFITDEATLLPGYLRFARGVIDSEDMPLNLSREMLQNNPLVTSIRNAVTKRLITELTKKAEKQEEEFASIWKAFGPVIKEGIYEDFERRDQLLNLARFQTTKGDDMRSLKDYVADMKENQTAIYYIHGDDSDAIARSPQLEGYKARGIEVLLLSDPVDAFWTSNTDGFDGKPFTSVTQGGEDLSLIKKQGDDTKDETKDTTDEGAFSVFLALMKQTLEGSISDVQRSERLTDSPVCLVSGEGGLNPYMERILAQSQNTDGPAPDLLAMRVLEINPSHPLIRLLADKAQANGADPDLEDAAHLLLDQARILEGEAVVDTADYARRLGALLSKSFG